MSRYRQRLRIAMPVGLVLLVAATGCGGDQAPGSQRTLVSPINSSTSIHQQVPILTVLSPKSGDRVVAPVPIQYEITGFMPGHTSLLVYLGTPGASQMFELSLTSPHGVVYLEDQPMVSGKRTLTIVVALDHRALDDASAQIVLRDVVIEGRKGG